MISTCMRMIIIRKQMHAVRLAISDKHNTARHSAAPCAPFLNAGEGLLVGDVINDKYASGAPEVRAGEIGKPLLAGSVPQLQLAALVFDFDIADLEINADGGNVGFVEWAFYKAAQ
jgi:hypothetical protein